MMWSPIARRACACLCLWLLGANASAQPGSSQEAYAIELASALSRAMTGNPDLVAFGYQVDAAEGRLRQAALAPNPELGITVEDALGTDAYRGADQSEVTITLGWILERGARQRIIDAARAGVSLRVADAEIARLDVAAETARRFLVCLAFQHRLQNANEAVRRAEEIVQVARERVSAGRALDAELARAEADLAWAELLQEDYEHELLSANHRLSAQWGATQPDFSAVAGTLEALPGLEPFDAILARVDQNADLARFMSQQRLNDADLRLAEARSRPSWHVYTGLRRFESTNDVALVGGITVPLPVRDRNQGRIAEARAEVSRTHAQRAAERIRIETALFVLYQALNHSLQLAARLSDDVIPKLDRAFEDTRRAYELGRSDYSEWRIVQAERLEAVDRLLEARVDAHRIVIEMERLTGARIASASPTAQ